MQVNKRSFSQLVEDFIRTHKGIDYLEAIIEVCEEHEVDPRDCKRLLNNSIIEHLEVEAMDLNLVVGGNPSLKLDITN